MPLQIIQADITKLKVDAIVNAANIDLEMGGGICGEIFRKAGIDDLKKACKELSPIKTGQAVITSGFLLPAKYIIHTAGPVYSEAYKEACESMLRKSYTNSLNLAKEYKLKSIAFPLISSGIYGYPKKDAFNIGKSAINNFLEKNTMDVYLSVYKDNLISLIMG